MIPLSLLFKLGGRLARNLLQAAIEISRKRVSVGSVALVLASVFVAYQLLKATHKPEDLTGWTKKINDTTTAVIASQDKTKLPALVDAAKATHGTLVAGVTVKTKPDTIFVPKEVIQSTVSPDSTREATLQQDTAGYKIRITAVAPPFPQPLKLGYSFITPEFHPEVGFEKVGNSYAAVVSWAGKTYTIENAFFAPAERRLPSWALTGQIGVESDFGSQSLKAPVVALQLTKTFTSGTGISVLGKNVLGHNEVDLVISHRLWSR